MHEGGLWVLRHFDCDRSVSIYPISSAFFGHWWHSLRVPICWKGTINQRWLQIQILANLQSRAADGNDGSVHNRLGPWNRHWLKPNQSNTRQCQICKQAPRCIDNPRRAASRHQAPTLRHPQVVQTCINFGHWLSRRYQNSAKALRSFFVLLYCSWIRFRQLGAQCQPAEYAHPLQSR